MRVVKSNLQCVITSLNHGVPTSYTAYIQVGGWYYEREYNNVKKAPKCVIEMAKTAPLFSSFIFNGEVLSEYRGIKNIFELMA